MPEPYSWNHVSGLLKSVWIPVIPSARLRRDTFVLLLPCCFPFPCPPGPVLSVVLVARSVLCSGTVSGAFVSRQGRAPQLPDQLFGILPPLCGCGSADQPFGHRAASQAPAPTSCWQKPRAKVSGDV